MEKPLLVLVMVVKDEADTLGATLRSALPLIDRWLILDTGSTDDTPEIARAILGHLPGRLARGPFLDFSQAYNDALDLAGEEAEFWLHLMGGETVADSGVSLRAFLWENKRGNDGAFFARVLYATNGEPQLQYDGARIGRTSARWRYVRPTHEVLHPPADWPGPRAPTRRAPSSFVVIHETGRDDPEAKRARWRRDAEMLRAEDRRTPNDARTIFYLAQSLECIGEANEAQSLYRRVVDLRQWMPYAYEAQLRIGQIAERAQQKGPALWAYLQAAEMQPHRAESWACAASLELDAGNWRAAHLFASEAVRCQPRDDDQFLRLSVWTWGRYYLFSSACWHLRDDGPGAASARMAEMGAPSNPLVRRLLAQWAYADQHR